MNSYVPRGLGHELRGPEAGRHRAHAVHLARAQARDLRDLAHLPRGAARGDPAPSGGSRTLAAREHALAVMVLLRVSLRVCLWY